MGWKKTVYPLFVYLKQEVKITESVTKFGGCNIR